MMASRARLLAALLAAVPWAPAPGSAQPPEAPSSRCMERHLREAAQMNRERMPLYAALTGGRSRGISRRLIWAERLGVPLAWYVDWRAREFQAAGIRVVCDDYVSMAHAPAFRARIPDPPPLSAFTPSDPRRIRRAVARAYRTGGFPAASTTIRREIGRLEGTPWFHCMTRHLLESALRISNQAPRYQAQARARGTRSPAEVSRLMLDLHLFSLGEASKLDRRAAPLQAGGIPILCQDVPPVPPG